MRRNLAVLSVAILAIAPLLPAREAQAQTADAIDWNGVPAQAVTLFYPGRSSYQWLRGDGHAAGMAAVAAGAPCIACHEGQAALLGERIVTGGPLEPDPIEGKPGTIELRVQAAHDGERLFLRMEWPTQADRPGQVHDMLRFDGKEWKPFGGPRSKQAVRSGEMPALYEDRLAIALDDGRVPMFGAQGCWLACHDGMRDMADEPGTEAVRAHPLLGQALGQSDVRKYLPETRQDADASWGQTRPAEEIAQLKADGRFMELMQWRAHRSNPVGMADDGYVLEYRLFDDGKGPFTSNFDKRAGTPRYMFDFADRGERALDLEQVQARTEPHALVVGENAIPFDPAMPWKEGDLLPSRYLDRSGASGSAADNGEALGTWEDGRWVVYWTRALDTGNTADDKPLRPGQSYTVSFAVHDDNVTTRFHHVSFPLTLGIGIDAEISAIGLE